MALPLGKLGLIIGAGLVGSVLAKEGRISNVPDFFTGAFKIAWKQLKLNDSSSSTSKPKNDSLLQQVNSLRQELQILASNRSVMIVTGDRSGPGRYGVIVIVVVAGYGYVWWKGWRLGDMMFATRRGLNDACSSVAKQLETVYSSISVTKRHLSSRIDCVDSKIDECADNTNATKEEVCELRGDVKLIGADVQSVHHVVRSLETKISRIEEKQSQTTIGVGKLVAIARNLENGKTMEQIEGGSSRPVLELPSTSPSRVVSSRPALELPPKFPSRTTSLPSNASSLETPSPRSATSNELYQRKQHGLVSASDLNELHAISEGNGLVSSISTPPQSTSAASEDTSNDNNSSGSSIFGGRKLTSFFTRSLSAKQSLK